jgi:hypothetical protein
MIGLTDESTKMLATNEYKTNIPRGKLLRITAVLDSKVSGGTTQKASADSLSSTQVRPGKVEYIDESRNRSPGFTTGSSVRETPEKETEQAEPGKAIDWILEKRSNK